MLLRHIGERPATDAPEVAVRSVLADGRVRTPAIGGRASTDDMTEAVTSALRRRGPVDSS
jgi:tartrate dehydrogenase/decarboxylase/D-malate dehydrogenase